MFQNYYILIFAIFIIVLTSFGIGRLILSAIFKLIFYILLWPYYLWRWSGKKRDILNRQKNYEILGEYIALLGNNPEVLSYLKKRIEKGISTEEFSKILSNNLENLKNYEIELQKELIKNKYEQECELKKMIAEQKEILIQSKLSLEQIRFREKLLDNLYQKIQRKYRL